MCSLSVRAHIVLKTLFSAANAQILNLTTPVKRVRRPTVGLQAFVADFLFYIWICGIFAWILFFSLLLKVLRFGLIHSSLPGNDSLWRIFTLLSAFVCVWVSGLRDLNKTFRSCNKKNILWTYLAFLRSVVARDNSRVCPQEGAICQNVNSEVN